MAESAARLPEDYGNSPKTVLIIDVSAADATFSPPLRAISFATAGDIKIDDESGNTVTIPTGALAAGVQHFIGITKIYQAGVGAGDTDESAFVGYR